MKNRRDRREPYAGDKEKMLSIKVPAEFKTKLKAKADKLGISVSALVRIAIDGIIEREYNA